MTKHWTAIICLSLIIIGLLIFIGVNGTPKLKAEIRKLKEENKALSDMLANQNFELSTLAIANQSLRLDRVELEQEILRLQVHEIAYNDMIEIWNYSLSYISYLQFVLDRQGIVYPEFTVQRIMEEVIEEGIE